jgi:hypothetical protein
MTTSDHNTQEETPSQNQQETMFETMERVFKELDSLRVEPPTLLTDEFDPCETCGS